MKQATTRVDDEEYELFQRTAASIGTTPSDALRMFIISFNDHHGFPYPVQSRRMSLEAFETEEEATQFATNLTKEILNEPWRDLNLKGYTICLKSKTSSYHSK